jgi:hypothetical protein
MNPFILDKKRWHKFFPLGFPFLPTLHDAESIYVKYNALQRIKPYTNLHNPTWFETIVIRVGLCRVETHPTLKRILTIR